MFDEENILVNIRRYSPAKQDNGNKMLSWSQKVGAERQNFGAIRLLLIPKSDTVLLCEGEMDALCAISNGYDATTTTGGAGNWKTEFNKYFVGKNVTICYDNDEAGRKGALKVIESLREAAASVAVAAIGEPGEDV